MYLALNNLQRLICHKTQQTKQTNQFLFYLHLIVEPADETLKWIAFLQWVLLSFPFFFSIYSPFVFFQFGRMYEIPYQASYGLKSLTVFAL